MYLGHNLIFKKIATTGGTSHVKNHIATLKYQVQVIQGARYFPGTWLCSKRPQMALWAQ